MFEAARPDASWKGEYRSSPAEMDNYYYDQQAESAYGKIIGKADVLLIRYFQGFQGYLLSLPQCSNKEASKLITINLSNINFSLFFRNQDITFVP